MFLNDVIVLFVLYLLDMIIIFMNDINVFNKMLN